VPQAVQRRPPARATEGGLREQFGRALPLPAITGGQVNLQLDQFSVDAP